MPYADVEGGQLWYDRSGSGEPVVLLHETIGDRRIWEDVVPLLADRFDVIAYDLRGFGLSKPWTGPYSAVGDLRSLLDGLGIERAALVGASGGGTVALDFTLTHPERVTALVLVASSLSGHSAEVGTEDQERRWEEAEAAGDLRAMVEIDIEIWAPLGTDERLRSIFDDNAEASNADDPVIGIDPPAKERLAEVRVPTLVVTGDEDVEAKTEIGDLLERGIPGARRVRLAGADHIVPLRKPHELAAPIRELLLASRWG